MIVNALGAVGTATTLIVELVAKFASGAWVSAFLIAGLVAIMTWVRRRRLRMDRLG